MQLEVYSIDLYFYFLDSSSGSIAGSSAKHNSNKLRKFVYATKDVKSWILVYSESDLQTANEFSDYLNQISKRMRISFSDPKLISLPDDNTGTYVNRIREEIQGDPQVSTFLFFLFNHLKLLFLFFKVSDKFRSNTNQANLILMPR